MRPNLAKRRLLAGKPIIGPLLWFPSPAFVELAALAGFHFVMFDCEHGPMDPESCEHLVRAAEAAGITPLARVPVNAPHVILRYLDIGIQGIMVPHIETADDLRAAVEAAKYPPEGHRSLAGVRAAAYGVVPSLREYMAQANAETMVIALLESRRALENLAALVQVPGVDVFHIGPADLSASLGYYGLPQHPAVQAAVAEIIAAVRAAGGRPGMGGLRGVEAVRQALERGVLCVTIGARDLVVDAGRALLGALPLD